MVEYIGLKVMTKTLALKKKLSKLKCLFKYPAGHTMCPAGDSFLDSCSIAVHRYGCSSQSFSQ